MMTVMVSPSAFVVAKTIPMTMSSAPPGTDEPIHCPGAVKLAGLLFASALILAIPAFAARPATGTDGPAMPPGVEKVAAWSTLQMNSSRGSPAAALQAALEREVPRFILLTPQSQAAVIGRTARAIETAGIVIDQPQLLLAVDRNPAVQEMHLVLARPDGERWEVIGGSHVSTGKPGRREHFKTPIGVFLNDGSILGYRAQGTYNENHIRGLGVQGMRVWDFGWQTTDNWHTEGTMTQIRLEMHATDPDVLEPRIGRPDSEGCVRVPTALNRFLEHYGIIDADLERVAVTDRRARSGGLRFVVGIVFGDGEPNQGS
jgi:hypothetical protein